MGIASERRRARWPQAALALALALAMFAPAAPARAQEDELVPGFSDGEWQAVIVANSQVVGEGVTTGAMHGEAHFTVSDGVLDGSWNMTGSAVFSGEGSGTAEFVAEGIVAGTAIAPTFPTTGGRITAVISIEGVTGEFSQDFPAGESALLVDLTSATCGQVIAEYEVSAPGMTGSGTLVATRVGDLRADAAPDFEARVTDLMADAMDFRDAAIASGSFPPGGLSELLGRAQELDRALRRAGDCSGAPHAADYHSLIAGVVADLLAFALENPDQIDSNELRTLVTILVATNASILVSDAAMDSLVDLVGERLEAAIDSGDVVDISGLTGVAAMIGAWDLVLLGSDAMGGD